MKLAFGFEILAPKILCKKRTCKMLMKLAPSHDILVCRGTPVGNHWLRDFLLPKVYKAKLRERMHKTLSYKKAAHKMLVKLTPKDNTKEVFRRQYLS
jgi:hypothetical protein